MRFGIGTIILIFSVCGSAAAASVEKVGGSYSDSAGHMAGKSRPMVAGARGSIRGEDRALPDAARAPSIELSDSSIKINSHSVKVGGALEAWSRALKAPPICSGRICTWPKLGIEVGTNTARTRVHFLDIHLQLPVREAMEDLITETPDGKVLPTAANDLPPNAFPGQLKLDNIYIRSGMPFTEITRQIAPSRRLRCGLRDCEFPHGAFSNDTIINLRLDGNSAHNGVAKFNLTRLGLE